MDGWCIISEAFVKGSISGWMKLHGRFVFLLINHNHALFPLASFTRKTGKMKRWCPFATIPREKFSWVHHYLLIISFVCGKGREGSLCMCVCVCLYLVTTKQLLLIIIIYLVNIVDAILPVRSVIDRCFA